MVDLWTTALISWRMLTRQKLVSYVAERIATLREDGIIRVGIDGADGAGKTVFADEVAAVIRFAGRPVIRAGIDSFHNPRNVRYRLGPRSPEGFFLDSYNYEALQNLLLGPLSPGGSRHFQTAAFNHTTNSPVSVPAQLAPLNAVLIFDGIFLHRPELRCYWDFSVFLDVSFQISIASGAQRGPGYGLADPSAIENRRYVDGQKLYFRRCDPKKHATPVIDNNDLSEPRILSSY